MAKRERRWPIWKIVLIMIGFIVAAVAFFVAGQYIAPEIPTGDENVPLKQNESVGHTMSNMLMLFGAICCAGTVICIGWLVIRYYQSIPAWKKRAKLPAHRRK